MNVCELCKHNLCNLMFVNKVLKRALSWFHNCAWLVTTSNYTGHQWVSRVNKVVSILVTWSFKTEQIRTCATISMAPIEAGVIKKDTCGTYRHMGEARKTSVCRGNLRFDHRSDSRVGCLGSVGGKVDIIIIRAIHWTVTMFQALTHLTLTPVLNRYSYLPLTVKEAKVFIKGVAWTQVTFKSRGRNRTQVYLAVKLRFTGILFTAS